MHGIRTAFLLAALLVVGACRARLPLGATDSAPRPPSRWVEALANGPLPEESASAAAHRISIERAAEAVRFVGYQPRRGGFFGFVFEASTCVPHHRLRR
ncbi:MAG: hypothetical protein ACC662_00035 [Planctomycetota bacterium]